MIEVPHRVVFFLCALSGSEDLDRLCTCVVKPRIHVLDKGQHHLRISVAGASRRMRVAGAPFLKGILAGFALAGAAATVRNMLGV